MCAEPLPLRPHHGMCLHYFAGRGYSEEFTAHMAGVKRRLFDDTPVRLLVGADAVCAACPNNLDGSCEKPALVAGFDREVLRLCGLEEEQVLPWGTFRSLVEERILAPGKRREICGECQWSGLCR